MNENPIFVAVRHGSYTGENLNEAGATQMRKVAEQIRKIKNGGRIVLLCSTAPRAKQGGEILIEELGLQEENVIFNECLWDDNRHWADVGKVTELVDANLSGNVVLVTISHLDLIPRMACYVAGKHGHEKSFGESSYGQGWIINSQQCATFPD